MSEDVPFYKNLLMARAVAQGRPSSIKAEIFADDHSVNVPLLRSDRNVKLLGVLEADLSSIPESELDRERGRDGQMYYLVDILIESICMLGLSARIPWCHNTDRS